MKHKVMHVITGLDVGGAEMMLYKVLKGWENEKYEHVVVSLIPPGKVGDLIKDLGIEVYSLNMKRGGIPKPTCLIQLMKIIKSEKPEIMNLYNFHADVIGRISGYICNVKIIISSIRNEKIGGRAREKVLGLTDFMVDKVTAVCYRAGKRQSDAGSFSKEKLYVIHNGIELEGFNKIQTKEKCILRGEFGIPENAKLYVTVGRLEEQKNHQLLIKSFSNLTNNNTDSFLLIVGDGHLRQNLEEQVKDLKIEDRVIFTGIRKDIPKILSISDVFVLSSNWEGFPNVVLEAMAANLPVLATDVGGNSEVIQDSKTGFLIPPNREDLLTKNLLSLSEFTNDKLEEIGKLGRERVEEEFQIKNTIKKTSDLYDSLLS